jgi:hypothetical protein
VSYTEAQGRALEAIATGAYYAHPGGGARQRPHTPALTPVIRGVTLHALAELHQQRADGRLQLTAAGRAALTAWRAGRHAYRPAAPPAGTRVRYTRPGNPADCAHPPDLRTPAADDTTVCTCGQRFAPDGRTPLGPPEAPRGRATGTVTARPARMHPSDPRVPVRAGTGALDLVSARQLSEPT